jgi:endoglucanase
MSHSYPRASKLAFALLAATGLGCASGANSTGAAGTTGTAGTGSAGTTGTAGTSGTSDPYAGYAAKALHVSGNKLVDTTGATVRLLGVNRAGTEYMCVPPTTGSYTFDGSTGPSSIAAMKSWHINTVRLPLNESCWLGVSGTRQAADVYQADIEDYVQRLHANGIYVVLDLHWSARTGMLATAQTTMAYADNAGAFWTSVATRFKADPMVIFDLYNEPILDAADGKGNNAVGDANAAWNCWLNGCSLSGGGTAAGMQSMLNAVRATGATQVVIAGGIDWAHTLDQWMSHKPNDPTGNLVAGFHVYDQARSNCYNLNCWNGAPATLASSVPIITGELGETDCAHGLVDSFVSWADSHGVSYLGWAWNPQNCGQFPALITNLDGTPTAFGQGLHDHLLQINP